MLKITAKQQKQINKIGKKYNLKLAVIHGSYAKDRARPGSDLDIAVLGKKKLDFDDIIKIYSDFGDVFGDNWERELDLKSLHDKDPLFRYYVIRDGILIYGNITDYHEFRAYAIKDYIESLPLFTLEQRLVEARHKQLMRNINHD